MCNGRQHRVHSVLVAVVEQHDVPVPGAAVDHVQYFAAVLGAPVLRVHRPVHQRHGQRSGLRLRQQAVGRPHPVIAVAQQLPQQRVVLLQILQRLPGRQLVQRRVVVGVVSHLMPLRRHALHDVRILHHLTAHHKEGGPGAQLLQPVQQPRRAAGRRAVVKGQRHIFHHLRLCFRRFLHHRDAAPRPAAGQQHQRRQQRTYSLPHLITGESICSATKKEHACRRVLFL